LNERQEHLDYAGAKTGGLPIGSGESPTPQQGLGKRRVRNHEELTDGINHTQFIYGR